MPDDMRGSLRFGLVKFPENLPIDRFLRPNRGVLKKELHNKCAALTSFRVQMRSRKRHALALFQVQKYKQNFSQQKKSSNSFPSMKDLTIGDIPSCV